MPGESGGTHQEGPRGPTYPYGPLILAVSSRPAHITPLKQLQNQQKRELLTVRQIRPLILIARGDSKVFRGPGVRKRGPRLPKYALWEDLGARKRIVGQIFKTTR